MGIIRGVAVSGNEILGKHRQKKKLWVTVDILHLCEKRTELTKEKI